MGRAGRPSHHPADERLHHEGVLEVADGVAVLGPALVDSCREQRNPSEDLPWPRTGWARKPPASEPEGAWGGGRGEKAEETKPRSTPRQCSQMLSAQELLLTNFSEPQFPHL